MSLKRFVNFPLFHRSTRDKNCLDSALAAMDVELAIYNLVEAIQKLDTEEAIYWARLVQINPIDLKSQQQQQLNLPFEQLFKGFNLDETDLSVILSRLIWDSIKYEDYPVIIEKFRDQIVFGLKDSKDFNVKKLCIDIVFKLGFESGHKPDELITYYTLQLISFSNYYISALIVKYMKDLNPAIIDDLMHPLISVFTEFKEQNSENSENSVILFRFLELFLYLSKNNEKYEVLFEYFKTDIKAIIIDYKDKDPLLAVNALQTLKDFIQEKEQFDLLASDGLINLLISLLKTYSSTSSNVISKILEIITTCALNGCFGSEYVESTGISRIILEIQENCFNEVVRESAIFCAAALASVSESLVLLNNYGEILKHGNSAHQLAALNGLGVYFSAKFPSNCLKHQFLLNLFSFFNENFFDWLENLCKSAFNEQKVSAYFAIKSIVSIRENFKFVLDQSTLIAKILNRELDQSRIGLQLKYEIIEIIYQDPDLQNCLNEALKAELKKYLTEGAFYSIESVRVAFESQS